MFRIWLEETEGPIIEFKLVGRNQASTFTGLCGRHDQQLFGKIDSGGISLEDPEHLFLIAYRAVIRHCHASMKAAFDTQRVYSTAIRRGHVDEDDPDRAWLATEKLIDAYERYSYKQRFDALHISGSCGALLHKVIELDASEPSVAANALLCGQEYSEATDSAQWVVINVFPADGRHFAVYSYLPVHELALHEYAGPIESAYGATRLYFLSKQLLKSCENLVIAPKVYDGFSEPQKEAILDYFTRNLAPYYDREDKNIYLFRQRCEDASHL